jgi:hypothetical protein
MSAGPDLDPRLRVLYLLGIAVGVFVLSAWWQLAAVLGLQLVLWFAVGLPLRRLGRQLFKLSVFALFIICTYAAFIINPETDVWVPVSILGFEFHLNKTGAIEGVLVVTRVLGVVLASQVARAGDPRAIASGLRKLWVPDVAAMSLDVVLALLGDDPKGKRRGRGGGGGGGGGGGRGGGRGRGHDDGQPKTPFWQQVKKLATGDVKPIVDNIEKQIARAEAHALRSGVSSALARDVSVVAGISLTMLAIKMLKLLPSLPFAPGHKLVLLTPLYIVAALLTRSRFGATLTGLTMGTVAFLLGDGRYGVFEIFKHIAPGVICDAVMPIMLRGGRMPGGFSWSVFGGVIAAGRFATIFSVTLAVQPPAVAYAILVPGLTVNVFFGVASGYVSYHLVKAALRLRDAHDMREALAEEMESDAGAPQDDAAQ